MEKANKIHQKSVSRKNRKKTPNGSFILSRHTTTEPVMRLLNSLLKGQDEQTQRLFKHILVSQKIQNKEAVIVPALTIRAYLPNANWRRLDSLLNVSDYRFVDGLARTFSVKSEILEEVVAAEQSISYDDLIQIDKFNLMDGRRILTPQKSLKFDDSGNAIPPLVQAPMDVIETHCTDLNKKEGERHLGILAGARDEAETTFGRESEEYNLAKKRFYNDDRKLRSILMRNPKINGEYLHYCPGMYATSTGRLVQFEGGFPMISREAKKALTSGLEGFHNLDMPNAYPRFVQQDLEDAGLPVSSLTEYNEPGARVHFAERAGVREKFLKKLILLSVGGAHYPKRMTNLDERNGAIIKEFRKEFKGDLAAMEETIPRVRKVIKGILEELQTWKNEFLESKWIPKNTQTRGSGGKTIKNAAGMKLRLSDLPKLHHERQPKVIAHYLQGREVEVAHTFAVKGKNFGYKTRMLEFDGLGVTGEGWEDAAKEVSKETNFRYAEVREKPFV